ncbi:glycosyltransferase family 39 protein [Novosphingobium sp. SL115]|uniref:ArnT family glycosyltransferase n=1 Tax=Novosphingobium sp. SL115 TaxID=2995150 RepID=UPI002273AB33|nr:glycosyltransferase family 39 protein [Novosphingobium sp. SL115]MCY1671847.1 glycosyltransferase family 39 protein [Novosphingobium sp. SL115]
MTARAIAAVAVLPRPMPVRAAALFQPVRIPDWLATALAYLGLALITRSFLLGNPIIHIDEQFYLFVAERMREGALPYVDIWDRKPIGLFLIYYILAAIPGDPVLAYQAGAVAAMVGTAMVIARLAREIASPTAAWQAGVAYLLFLPAFNAAMGQAPVFYNLLVALAALALVQTVKRNEDHGLVRRGALVMLLLGLAIQIKYTVVFEGMAFGLILLSRGYADVWSWRKLAGVALLWMGVALLPTLAAMAWYAGIGQLDAFIYANFVSVFGRESDGWKAPWRLTKEVAALLPFWLAIFRAPKMFDTRGGIHPRSHGVLIVWGLAACLGFLLFGTWYDHYVAPLLVPLCVLAAPALARLAPSERGYGRFLLGFGAVASVTVPAYQVWRHGTAAQFEEMSGLIRREMRDGCLYIYEGELAFYRTINSCVPTARIFPNHLNTFVEAKAVGVDPVNETRKILASKPEVVLMWAPTKLYLPNKETRRVVSATLAQEYQRFATYTLGTREYWLYRLRPAPQPVLAQR